MADPKIILDPCVEEELAAIWSYIAQDNPEAATRLIEAAFSSFEALAIHPRLGVKRHFQNRRLREVRSWRISGFENYLIFYRPVTAGIQVIHVYHGARDIDRLFGVQ